MLGSGVQHASPSEQTFSPSLASGGTSRRGKRQFHISLFSSIGWSGMRHPDVSRATMDGVLQMIYYALFLLLFVD